MKEEEVLGQDKPKPENPPQLAKKSAPADEKVIVLGDPLSDIKLNVELGKSTSDDFIKVKTPTLGFPYEKSAETQFTPMKSTVNTSVKTQTEVNSQLEVSKPKSKTEDKPADTEETNVTEGPKEEKEEKSNISEAYRKRLMLLAGIK